MRQIIPIFKRLRREQKAATIVELGFAAPIFFMILIGIFDLGYAIYCRSVLVGAVNEAGRASGLRTGVANKQAIDDRVKAQVQQVMPKASLTYSRKNYQTFSAVNQPEDFIDANGNNAYNSPECFTDINANNRWDADPSSDGQGTADDVVLYTVTMQYQDIFPLWKFIGLDSIRKTEAATLLRNQPYADQVARVPIQVCP